MVRIDLSKIKKLKIGMVTYDVYIPYNFKERDDYAGQIAYDEGEIRVSAKTFGQSRKPVVMFNTLIHEILHGIDRLYSIGLFDEKDERKLEQLSHAITSFLLDNGFVEITHKGR